MQSGNEVGMTLEMTFALTCESVCPVSTTVPSVSYRSAPDLRRAATANMVAGSSDAENVL